MQTGLEIMMLEYLPQVMYSMWVVVQSADLPNNNPPVALSSYEPEYMGQTQAIKEAIWLKMLLTQLDNLASKLSLQAVIIHCDNQRALALAKNLQFHSQSYKIDIQW